MAKQRAPMKTVIGTVVSDKMQKTITVREERMVKHPLYGKYVRRATVYRAHDEANEAREGDRVEILFTRPQSKTKHWRLLRVLRRAPRAEEAMVLESEELAAAETAATTATAPAPAPEEALPEAGTTGDQADEATPPAEGEERAS